MKLAVGSAIIESNGLSNDGGFRIAANAKAFAVLSSSLYSRKEEAVIRELACNAQDSHIAAGNKQPVEVMIPNKLVPQFYVKDWGTGLSKEAVEQLYTTYFASTKEDSNDFTGAFGLGSKSPFAYTDQFYIESAHGGVLRVYLAFLNEEGVPRISLISEKPVEPEWPTGVKVGFPVREADIHVFKQAAQEVLQWLDPMPRVLGIEELTPPKWRSEPLPLFGLLESPRYLSGDERVAVLMGGVYYPFPLEVSDYEPLFAEALQCLPIRTILVLKAEIGSLSVAASREQLTLDRMTKQGLVTLQNKYIQTLREDADMAASNRTPLQLKKAATSGTKEYMYGNMFKESSPLWNFVWRGDVLEFLKSFPELPTPECRQRKDIAGGYQALNSAVVGKNWVMLENDKGVNPHQYLREALKDQPEGTLASVFPPLTPGQREILLGFGVDEIRLVSTMGAEKSSLPKAPKRDTLSVSVIDISRLPQKQLFLCGFGWSARSLNSGYVEKALDLDTEPAGFFLPRTGTGINMVVGEGATSFKAVERNGLSREAFDGLFSTGQDIQQTVIPLVTAVQRKKFEKAGWTNLLDWMKEEVKRVPLEPTREIVMAAEGNLSIPLLGLRMPRLLHTLLTQHCESSSMYRDLDSNWLKGRSLEELRVAALRTEAYNLFGFAVPKANLDSLEDKWLKTWPFLTFIGNPPAFDSVDLSKAWSSLGQLFSKM